MKIVSNSVEETERIAAELTKAFKGGEVIALIGDLGAGKTQFVRGLVGGLGGNTRSVSSPTYVLLNIYDSGRLTVYHMDAYRADEESIEAIGFLELLEQGGVVVVEWPQRLGKLMPENALTVSIIATGETSREIEIKLPLA